MKQLSFEQFEQQSAEFDERVLATADIDHYCSSTNWIVPAARALMPPRAPLFLRGEHGSAALMRVQAEGGLAYLEPLEAMWGLACPVVGGDAAELAWEFAAAINDREQRIDPAAENQLRGEVLVLCGLSLGSTLFRALCSSLGATHRLRLGPTTERCVADLRGGIDAFVSRRSPHMRRGLGKARRRAELEGVCFHSLSVHRDPESARSAFERLLTVEERSWKGHDDTGLSQPQMQGFYREMVPRLAARGALRLMFAEHRGRDVGYILGGILGHTYRGLQFSFDDDPLYRRLSLGNLAQYHQIAALCEADPTVDAYDLGTASEYKRRWAEGGLQTVTLIAQPF